MYEHHTLSQSLAHSHMHAANARRTAYRTLERVSESRDEGRIARAATVLRAAVRLERASLILKQMADQVASLREREADRLIDELLDANDQRTFEIGDPAPAPNIVRDRETIAQAFAQDG